MTSPPTGPPWTPDETSRMRVIIEASDGKPIPAEVYDEHFPGRSPNACKNKATRERVKMKSQSAYRDALAKRDARPPSELPAASERAKQAHTAKYNTLKGIKGLAVKSGERTTGKTLVFSDVHGHLVRADAVAAAVEANLDAERVVIAGDVFDSRDVSFFSNDARTPLPAEWDLVGAMMESLCAVFLEIHLIRGNHDARHGKIIRATLKNSEFYPLMRDAMDPVGMLAKGMGFAADGEIDPKRYDWGGKVFYNRAGISNSDGAVIRIGQALISHTDRYLGGGQIRIPGTTAVKLSAMYRSERNQPHDCFIQAHTHHLAQIYKGDALAIECGAMCDEPEYVTNAKLSYGAQTVGWVELYQHEDGSCDMGRTRAVYWG